MVGVLDSGVGGLSVWKELVGMLPDEKYLYVADSGYCPYGPRDKSYIIERTSRISEFLIDKGADIIVVACNTATAAAISTLRRNYNIPFIGMEPATKPAVLHSESGVIAVLATQGTFRGELYMGTLEKYASQTKVIEIVGTGLVELVEKMAWDTPEAEKLVRSYVEPAIALGADHIVLGCTHYPFLTKTIEKIAGSGVKIVNPAPAIAKRAREVLAGIAPKNLYSEDSDLFCTTAEDTSVLASMVGMILSESPNNVFRKYRCTTIRL